MCWQSIVTFCRLLHGACSTQNGYHLLGLLELYTCTDKSADMNLRSDPR